MSSATHILAGSPVQYPTISVGGKPYQLRFAHAAWFLLQQWGYVIGDANKVIPIAALAAAAAGEIDSKGRWRSVGFGSPLEMLDQMTDTETLSSFDGPVLEALKKAAPGADLTVAQQPPAVTDQVN
jgi:hypothetical protein